MRVNVRIMVTGNYIGESPENKEVEFTNVSGPFQIKNYPGKFRETVDAELQKALDYLGVDNEHQGPTTDGRD